MMRSEQSLFTDMQVLPDWCYAGLFFGGIRVLLYEGYAAINPLGQIGGAIIMFGVLGFLPGYIIAKILNAFNYLRIPKEIELMGLDFKNNQDQKSAEEDVRQAEKAFT